ncbi:MAG TPA: SRPBCC domain-containing protein [Pseudomonadales bacterium]
MFRHTVYSDPVIINAPVERVWHVLTDLEHYPDWNPFTFQVLGELTPGRPVELHVRMPGKSDTVSVETVLCVDQWEKLSWGLTMLTPLLLQARRDQQLQALSASQCRYQTWDAFSGLLTPIVIALYGNSMQQGFNAVALALKQHCEQPV